MFDVPTAHKLGFARYNLDFPKIRPNQPVHSWKLPKVDRRVEIVARYPTVKFVKPTDPFRDNLSQIYQEDAHIIHTTRASLWEVCRFYVPTGRIGVVRQIWQWIEIRNPPATPPVVGTPYDARTDSRDNANPITLLWKLRCTSGRRNVPLIEASASLNPPGWPLTTLPNWKEYRFPWGSSVQVFLLIPEHTTLSLYVQATRGADYVDYLGGRLAGYTQTMTSIAQQNARHGFQW